ncbi:LppM family (lipo)protein [Demequina flava]|uniref:LppM family (lipo)protein n=1 Tax=Demequina flava TaxID=1095025 RepID=UPI0007816A0A|nr:hypothetical protein [Demequina flava]
MKTTARALALSIVSVLALAGCMKIDMDLTLNPDDTMSGSVLMAVEEGTGESLGLSDEELAEQMFADTESDFPGGTVEEYNADGYIGQKTSFENQPLEEFGATTDGMQIYRDEDDYVVESDAPFNEGTDLSQLPETAEATMSVTFPGTVHESNGTLEGTTVTWNLFEMDEPVYARGSAQKDASFPVWIIAVVGLALGVLVGIVLWLTLRGKKSDGADAAVTEGAPVTDETGTEQPAVGAAPGQPIIPAPADLASTQFTPDTSAESEPVEVAPVAPTPELTEPLADVEPVANSDEASTDAEGTDTPGAENANDADDAPDSPEEPRDK